MARRNAVRLLPHGLSLLTLYLLLAAPAPAQELTEAERAINDTIVLGEAPSAWLGATPHFVMVGTYQGHYFNIQAADISAVQGIEIEGKREYRPAEGGGLDYIDFEIAVDLVTSGIERSLELEFENADFGDHTLPASFALQGEEFPEGALSNLELQVEWEWVEKSVVVNLEELMTGGTLTLALDTGEPDADGVAANGWIGGFVTAEYEGESIAISFTAPVVEAEIDD